MYYTCSTLIILFDQVAWVEDNTTDRSSPYGKPSVVHFKSGEQCEIKGHLAGDFIRRFVAWLDGPRGKEVGFNGA